MSCIGLIITGGSGLAGQALQKIHTNAIYISSKDFDLTKEKEVKAMFEEYKPDEVIHLAAKVGGIIKNMKYPADMLYENTLMNSFVIHYACKYNVKKLIGVLSNCAYPDIAENYPLREEYLYSGPPQKTNFAYAYSKRTLGVQIDSYRKQFNCNFFSVIPCNMYGPNDCFGKGNSHFVAALIRKIHEAKVNNKKTINLMGTGKPLRQYLYSEDFAKILLLLLDKYEGEKSINVAPAKQNPSIAKIAEIALEATDSQDIKIIFDESSPDGQYRKDLDTNRLIDIIGNFKFTSLSGGIKKTYEWYLNNIANMQKKE